MRKFKFIFFGLSLFTTIIFARETLDSICVVVDDEVILESEVVYGVNSILLEQGQKSNVSDEQISEIRQQVIKSYIIQKILLSKATEDTLSVEDRVVNKETEQRLATLIQQAGSEEKLVAYFGRSIPQIKRELKKAVKEGLLINEVRRKLFKNIQVGRQDVYEFYSQHKDELPTVPEQIELSHILLEVKVSDAARDSALRKAQYILQLLQQGADFDSLAKVYSEDPSAEQGGRLGMTTRGDLVPEFEEVAYALEPEMISDVIETRFGFHIIRLLERQGERISCQHILIKLTPTQDDWDAAYQLAEQLCNQVKQGVDFSKLVSQYSDDKSSREKNGKFEKMNTKDLPEQFRMAIANIPEGEITKPFETEYGVHILKIDKIWQERSLSLVDDYSLLEQYALNLKREQVFQKWIQKQLDAHYIYPTIQW